MKEAKSEKLDKAPGSDGFPAAFFQTCWDVIKFDVWAAIRNFFRSGRLIKEANYTIITLIPKTETADRPHLYICSMIGRANQGMSLFIASQKS